LLKRREDLSLFTQQELAMPGRGSSSIKKPKTYEALKRKGMSKARAARISNAQKNK
jgi:hypothetical protein